MTFQIRWQILIILFGVVVVGILLTYLAVNYTTVLQPGRGGTYVEGLVGSPRYLNPLLSSYTEVDRTIVSLLFSGLTKLNARGEFEPDLARSWEVSPDGLSYTFNLRANAYWHDGTTVTVDDVLFTIRLLQDPEFPGPPELGASLWKTVAVERVNPYVVRFTLPEPFAPFMDYTTVGILPVHILRGTRAADLPSSRFNLSPVGSGPFQMEEIAVEADEVTSLVLGQASRDFRRPKPYLGRVQFRFYPTRRKALDAYEEGIIQGISQILQSDLPRVRALPGLNLYSAQTAEYATVLLNLSQSGLPFMLEREFRQALLLALDRQQIVDEALAGQALVAHSPLIPGTWAHNPNVKRYEQDLDEATKLLSEIDGFWEVGSRDEWYLDDQRVAFTLLTSAEPGRVRVARLLAEQWESLRISVTVAISSPLQVREALVSRDFDAILVHMMLPGDPDPYPFWHETQIEDGQNYAGLAHRRISETLERARVTVNPERRRALYYEFQELFAEEVPALPMYVPVYTYGVDERIHNVQIGPLVHPADRFRTIADWWIVPRRVFVSELAAGRP